MCKQPCANTFPNRSTQKFTHKEEIEKVCYSEYIYVSEPVSVVVQYTECQLSSKTLLLISTKKTFK